MFVLDGSAQGISVASWPHVRSGECRRA